MTWEGDRCEIMDNWREIIIDQSKNSHEKSLTGGESIKRGAGKAGEGKPGWRLWMRVRRVWGESQGQSNLDGEHLPTSICLP